MNMISKINISSFVPIACLVLFAITTYILFTYVGLHEIDILKQGIHDYQGRLYWIISVLALLIACVYSLNNSIQNILSYFPGRRHKLHLFVLVICLVLVFTFFSFLFDGGGVVGKELRDSIKDKTIIDVQFANNLIKTFAGLVVFLIIANISIIYSHMSSGERSIDMISKEIRNSFHTSSVFLAIGIIEIYFLYSWGASCSGDDSILPLTSKPLILGAGAFYSLMLLLIYVPLFSRRDEIVEKNIRKMNFQTKKQLSDWCIVNSVEEKSGREFKDILAFMSPIISGVAINILSKYL